MTNKQKAKALIAYIRAIAPNNAKAQDEIFRAVYHGLQELYKTTKEVTH